MDTEWEGLRHRKRVAGDDQMDMESTNAQAFGKGKWKGKGKGKGKSKGKWKDVCDMLLFGQTPGLVLKLSRFDSPDSSAGIEPLQICKGDKAGIVTLSSPSNPQCLLRIKWDGIAELKGRPGGGFTRFRVATADDLARGVGEIALYNVKTHLWLTIEPDGRGGEILGSSTARRQLNCRILTDKAPQDCRSERSEPDGTAGGECCTTQEAEPPDEDPKVAEDIEDSDEKPISPELYWKNELQILPVLDLKGPPLHPMDSYLSHNVNVVERHVCLEEVMSETVMLATWTALLCRLSRAEELVVGVEQCGVGDGGPLIVRVPVSLDCWTLKELEEVVRGKLEGSRCHAGNIAEALSKEMGGNQTLVQTGFVYGDALLRKVPFSYWQCHLQTILRLSWPDRPDLKFDSMFLQLRCAPTATGVTLQLLHVVGRVSIASAHRMLAHLENMLTKGEGMPCGAIELSSASERSMLLQWSDLTSEKYETCADKCIHDLFLQQVNSSADQIAVVSEGSHLSYAQLAAASSQTAEQLISLGVEPDTLVPLMADRSLEMIVGIYGILFAGAGYAPLDTKWPDERVEDVIGQCVPKAVCAGLEYYKRLSQWVSNVVDLSLTARMYNRASTSSSVRRPGGGGIVYCFFTSGSTGKPKGVIVEHRGLVHRIQWFQARWGGMRPGECGILKHSYTFGLSEWEIFWPLSFGATLVLCKPDGEKDVGYLWELSEKHQVRTQVFVPSVLRALLDHADMELQDQALLWPHLRHAITCGEALPSNLAQLFFDFLPHAKLDNLYGPTEGEMTVWRCPKGEIIQSVPIGVPMEGSRVLVHASADCLAAIGEPGEIHFAGQFIARGYLGLPELTAEKFVEDRCEGAHDEGRAYASGDLARWRESGVLDFLGRADFQVKIRGFRIELGEIEEALRNASAKSAVCIVHGEGSQQRLVAFVTPETLQVAELKASCARRLPAYMIPSQFVPLREFPKSASGKVDRRKLDPPAEQGDDAENEGMIVKPSNEIEESIQKIWADVLQKPANSLSVEADWPLVGGNSLLAGKATSLLRKELGVQFPGTTMYTHSTIAKLAEFAVKLGVTTLTSQKDEMLLSSEVASHVPAEKRYQGLDANSFFALCAQFFCSVLGCAMGDMGSNVIRWSLIWISYVRFGLVVVLALLPLLLALAVILEAALCIFLKHALVGQLIPGEYPLWGTVYFRWLCGRHIVEKARDRLSEIISGTSLLAALYRALGATIGDRVDLNDPELEEPDLVCIGDDVEIHHARFGTAAIMDGQLILGRVTIESKCRVNPRAMLVQGTHLSESTEVASMATTVGWKGNVGAVCPLQPSEIHRVQTQDRLRIFGGIPLILLLHSAPFVPILLVLEVLWRSTSASSRWWFWLLVPAIYRHAYALIFFLFVVLQKRLLVGPLLPGRLPEENTTAWHWEVFRTWLHEQAVCARAFDDAVDPFVGGEVLSSMYRLLGVKVGRRVQIDNFHVAEPDCVTIGDDAVLGSVISIYCGSPNGREQVQLHRGANILDHCCVHAGACIGERAVLGSATLAPQDSYFPPESVSTGQVGGKPVRLRFQVSSEEQQHIEEHAMSRLNSDLWFWGFNSVLLFAALVCSPLPYYAALVTYFLASHIYATCGLFFSFLVLPFAHFTLNILFLALNWAIKRCLIGQYREGNYTFFGGYHLSWTVMMILSGVMEDVLDALQGTQFLVWYYRMMGAKVGRNCCLFGLAFEYDLLTIDDNCSIGWECDTTCHTVENMVIKLAPTALEAYTSMLSHSMVSPGATMGHGSVLLENSQVLKGEQVPSNEMWAGLPASSCGAVSTGDEEIVADEPPEIDTKVAQKASLTQPSSDASGTAVTAAMDSSTHVKIGMSALEESAVIDFKGKSALPKFLVEWLRNGSLCLWALEPDGRSLGGHLRISRNGAVDFSGGRGPWAQFVPIAVSANGKPGAGLTLRGLGSGLFLYMSSSGELSSSQEACALQVQQHIANVHVLMPRASQRERRREGVLLLHERREAAAYALQAERWSRHVPASKAKAKAKPKAKAKRAGA